MGQQIIKQPNGLYAIWSSVVDDVVAKDLNRVEIVDLWTQQARESYLERVNKECDFLDAGDVGPYRLTWEAAMAERKRVHGKAVKPVELCTAPKDINPFDPRRSLICSEDSTWRMATEVEWNRLPHPSSGPGAIAYLISDVDGLGRANGLVLDTRI